jgi:metal-responsive CopG/Arc/MetJ family transcriptional regulator
MKKIPDGQKKVVLNFTIDPQLLQRLREFCAKRMSSRSVVIRRGIEMVMDAENRRNA